MGKIAEKAVCGGVFLTTWHCILSAEFSGPMEEQKSCIIYVNII